MSSQQAASPAPPAPGKPGGGQCSLRLIVCTAHQLCHQPALSGAKVGNVHCCTLAHTASGLHSSFFRAAMPGHPTNNVRTFPFRASHMCVCLHVSTWACARMLAQMLVHMCVYGHASVHQISTHTYTHTAKAADSPCYHACSTQHHTHSPAVVTCMMHPHATAPIKLTAHAHNSLQQLTAPCTECRSVDRELHRHTVVLRTRSAALLMHCSNGQHCIFMPLCH